MPVGRSRNIASTPSERAISCPAITPPIAGETTALIFFFSEPGIRDAISPVSRAPLTGSINSRAHCK